MLKSKLVKALPFSSAKERFTLIENKRAFTLNELELNVFETYQASEKVPLRFEDLVIINMIHGRKIMHLQHVDAFDYLPGQMMVLPADSTMKIDFPDATLSDPTQCTALTISKQKIEEVLSFLNENYPREHVFENWDIDLNLFHFHNTPELTSLINKLFETITGHNPLKDVLVDLTFKELVIRLLQTQSLLRLNLASDTNKSVLQHIKYYIQKNIAEPITIELLEKQANMSKSSLYRLFKHELGVTPIEYIILERINKAKELLKKTKSVKETCFSLGFNDVNYFVRLFKNRVGITPGAYMFS